MFFKKNKKQSENKITDTEDVQICENSNEHSLQNYEVSLEKISDEQLSGLELTQVNDNKLLNNLSLALPELLKFGDGVKASKTCEGIYRITLKEGQSLVKSRAVKGAVRGMVVNDGSTKIAEQANLIPIGKTACSANSTQLILGVAVAVAVAHYLSDLEDIAQKINIRLAEIIEFLDNEYKGKVVAVVTEVTSLCAAMQSFNGNKQDKEMLLAKLDTLEFETTKLISQANITIMNLANGNPYEFKNYENAINKIDGWLTLRNYLMNMLQIVAVLKYLNGNGTLTKESSCVLLDKYIKYADDVAEELNKFHRSCERKFGVDTANLLRKRDGLNGLLYKIPAVFDSKHNYCTLQKSVAEKIERQKNEKINSCALPENFSFIIHSNKVFYCIDKKS